MQLFRYLVILRPSLRISRILTCSSSVNILRLIHLKKSKNGVPSFGAAGADVAPRDAYLVILLCALLRLSKVINLSLIWRSRQSISTLRIVVHAYHPYSGITSISCSGSLPVRSLPNVLYQFLSPALIDRRLKHY